MKKLSCWFMLILLAGPVRAGQRQDFANQLVVLMNSVRGATGLPQLQVNVQLTQSAQEYAALMAARNWLCHIAPDGSDPNVIAGHDPGRPDISWDCQGNRVVN